MKPIALLLVSLLLTACTRHFPQPDAEQRAVYSNACAPIITWLYEQKTSSGDVPDTLPIEYSQVLESLGPPTRYHRGATGSFSIAINKYTTESAWMYYFDSRYGVWKMDN